MLNCSSIKIEIQESTLSGGSHNDNKKEKQSGETRIMAFEIEEMILHVCNVSKLTLQHLTSGRLGQGLSKCL